MRRRSPVRNILEYAIAVAALKSLEWAPLGLANRLARGYARLLDAAVPRLRRVAEKNLSFAMPEAGPQRRTELIDGVFASIARTLVAFAKFPRINRDNVARWIRVEGIEHYDRAVERGHGVLIATAHLGNWELSAFAHALMATPMHVLVRPLDNPLLDTLVERRRALSGNRPVFKKDFARSILKALAANEAVGILIDQNAGLDSGVFVDFFGMPACAHAGFARMAAHSGATVIPGFAVWSAQENRYILRFLEPIEITGDATHDTRRLQAVLEQAIRDYPDQWLWIHRRWKTRPEGSPPLY
jgi:Kdo2-lipid IVA lauroyltransferase/acyltransferase